MTFWIRLRESMWVLPTLFVLGGVVLAVLMLYLDTHFAVEIERLLPGMFDGSAEAARVVLGTIAGSMATVLGVAFSIVIVVLQLAAGQYSPRVITTFRRDRGQQVVLGTYLATFIYALLVVRQVRSPTENGDAFVPGLSMMVAVGLALVSLGMLVYFVHHTSEQLRVTDVARRIHGDLLDIGDKLFPEGLGEPYDPERDDDQLVAELIGASKPSGIVRSEEAGYLQMVNHERLAELSRFSVETVRLCPRIGDFIIKRGLLVELYFDGTLATNERHEIEKCARACFVIGAQPTVTQNPELGIQQLVDIALRALSPGVNDPTSAEQVLPQLGDWLGRLAHRSFPSQVRRLEGGVVIAPRPSFADHVAETFDQIRRTARPQVHVLHTLLATIASIAHTEPPRERLTPLRRQVEAIQHVITESNIPEPSDRRRLEAHVYQVIETLDR